jgi:hypothetical protein
MAAAYSLKLRHATVLLTLGCAAVLAHAQRASDPIPAIHQQPAVQTAYARATQPQLDTQPKEAELLSHRHYKTRNGQQVHAPAASTHGQVPAGASAQCRDGSYSFSQHRRGTCSHHGGVASWM